MPRLLQNELRGVSLGRLHCCREESSFLSMQIHHLSRRLPITVTESGCTARYREISAGWSIELWAMSVIQYSTMGDILYHGPSVSVLKTYPAPYYKILQTRGDIQSYPPAICTDQYAYLLRYHPLLRWTILREDFGATNRSDRTDHYCHRWQYRSWI